MATTTSTTTANLKNGPLVLKKVTLRYQDAAKVAAAAAAQQQKEEQEQEGSYEDSLDEETYQISEYNVPINQNTTTETGFFLDEHRLKRLRNRPLLENERSFSIEKSLNRLSLLKFREQQQQAGNGGGGGDSSHNDNKNIKRQNKVNSIVNEIVPLISNNGQNNNGDDSNLIYTDYYDQTSSYIPSLRTTTTTLPKVGRSATMYQHTKPQPLTAVLATANNVTTLPTTGHGLPRPYSNNIRNKSKMFNLVYGINSKFIEKYLPREKPPVTSSTAIRKNANRDSLYLNEKLPGHLALYKLMKENSKTNLLPQTAAQTSMELDRIRKEILSRNTINQSVNEYTAPASMVDYSPSPRIENISPTNFTFNKETLRRSLTFHERRSISNIHLSHPKTSETPTLALYSAIQLKAPESVNAYLAHLKNDKV